MRRRSQHWYQSRNAKERREKLLQRSRKGVAAREAKRMADPTPREPKMVAYYPLELGVRDKASAETAWVDFRSVRDAARRLRVVQKFYRVEVA